MSVSNHHPLPYNLSAACPRGCGCQTHLHDLWSFLITRPPVSLLNIVQESVKKEFLPTLRRYAWGISTSPKPLTGFQAQTDLGLILCARLPALEMSGVPLGCSFLIPRRSQQLPPPFHCQPCLPSHHSAFLSPGYIISNTPPIFLSFQHRVYSFLSSLSSFTMSHGDSFYSTILPPKAQIYLESAGTGPCALKGVTDKQRCSNAIVLLCGWFVPLTVFLYE